VDQRGLNQRGTTLAYFLRYPAAVLGSGLVAGRTGASDARSFLIVQNLLRRAPRCRRVWKSTWSDI